MTQKNHLKETRKFKKLLVTKLSNFGSVEILNILMDYSSSYVTTVDWALIKMFANINTIRQD